MLFRDMLDFCEEWSERQTDEQYITRLSICDSTHIVQYLICYRRIEVMEIPILLTLLVSATTVTGQTTPRNIGESTLQYFFYRATLC